MTVLNDTSLETPGTLFSSQGFALRIRRCFIFFSIQWKYLFLRVYMGKGERKRDIEVSVFSRLKIPVGMKARLAPKRVRERKWKRRRSRSGSGRSDRTRVRRTLANANNPASSLRAEYKHHAWILVPHSAKARHVFPSGWLTRQKRGSSPHLSKKKTRQTTRKLKKQCRSKITLN